MKPFAPLFRGLVAAGRCVAARQASRTRIATDSDIDRDGGSYRSLFAGLLALGRHATAPAPRPARVSFVERLAAALSGSAALVRALGPVGPSSDAGDAWIDWEAAGATQRLRIHWRGQRTPGEPVSRELDDAGNVLRVSKTTGGSRYFSLDDLKAAIEPAKAVLRTLGLTPGAMAETRHTAYGGVAVIAVRGSGAALASGRAAFGGRTP